MREDGWWNMVHTEVISVLRQNAHLQSQLVIYTRADTGEATGVPSMWKDFLSSSHLRKHSAHTHSRSPVKFFHGGKTSVRKWWPASGFIPEENHKGSIGEKDSVILPCFVNIGKSIQQRRPGGQGWCSGLPCSLRDSENNDSVGGETSDSREEAQGTRMMAFKNIDTLKC